MEDARLHPLTPIDLEKGRFPNEQMPESKDAEMEDLQENTQEMQQKKQQQHTHPRRIWSKRTTTSSKRL